MADAGAGDGEALRAEREAQAHVDRGWARVAAMGGEFVRMATAAGLATTTFRYGRGTAGGFDQDGTRDGWLIGVDEDATGTYRLAVLDDGRWALCTRRTVDPGAGDETLTPAGWSTFARFFTAWVDVADATEDGVDDAVGRVRATLAARLRG